jgi:hypothetical protein
MLHKKLKSQGKKRKKQVQKIEKNQEKEFFKEFL